MQCDEITLIMVEMPKLFGLGNCDVSFVTTATRCRQGNLAGVACAWQRQTYLRRHRLGLCRFMK